MQECLWEESNGGGMECRKPRRFGKTMGMSMLAHFFDIREDNKELFDGLAVSEDSALCEKWMNKWPVLFLTLKDINGLTFEDAYGRRAIRIANLYKEHVYLLDKKEMDADDREIFMNLKAGTADKNQVSQSLYTLMRLMQEYYQKPVILLLDEYDVPIAKASNNGYYREMLDVMKEIMGSALKDNPFLHFAVVTGCLRIAKESIFTGTNNFVIDSISDSRYDECFGFTQAEVEQILRAAGGDAYAEKVKNGMMDIISVR